MRGTHWGKGTIGLQAAVPKRLHTLPSVLRSRRALYGQSLTYTAVVLCYSLLFLQLVIDGPSPRSLKNMEYNTVTILKLMH